MQLVEIDLFISRLRLLVQRDFDRTRLTMGQPSNPQEANRLRP
jgi:hypothetical protein